MHHMTRWILAAGVVAGLCWAAGLLIANFVGGETKIECRIERLYTLDNPRFVQELGVLLGPPFLQGTRVRALQNGGEIFPAMLAAIRGARASSPSRPTSTGRATSVARSPMRWPSVRASAQTATFEAYLALAGPVTYEQWQARPVRERIGDWPASFIGSQL
jgi:hypothetical protein